MSGLLDRASALAAGALWDELRTLVDQHPEIVVEQDEFGQTLLLICAQQPGSSGLIKRLAVLGADVNHRAFDGSSALAAAIVGGSEHGLDTLNELRTLLEAGADPEAVADSGMPALHWAISQNRLRHARILLEHGARTDSLTSDEPPETAEDVARRLGLDDAIELLGEFARC